MTQKNSRPMDARPFFHQPSGRPSGAAHFAAVTVALLTILICPTAAVAQTLRTQKSPNWAGYAVTARRPIRQVRGTWVQPTVVCSASSRANTAFWVGLGGFKKGFLNPLEQIGTEARCFNGHAELSAFEEIYPSGGRDLRIAVTTGDILTAEVSVRGDDVALKLANLTTGVSHTQSFRTLTPNLSSAEWIAESPSTACRAYVYCQQILPLANFGEVAFSEADASLQGGKPTTISAPHFSSTEIFLHDRPGLRFKYPERPEALGSLGEASPGPLSEDGSSFAVTWQR